MPLVSILIPAHNAERWIVQTLDSVFTQTHDELEIIVVDDGSRDSTLAVAREYAALRGDSRLRIETQSNAGAAAARNHALRLSRGEFIRFLDADDLLSPEATSVQVAALAQHPRHLAHGIWGRFSQDPRETRFVSHPGWHDSDSPVSWICETWADNEPMYQCGLFLIPRMLLERAGPWDERLSLIDDFEFFTRLILSSEGIAHTPEARVYYRSNLLGSLSAAKSRQAIESGCLSTRLATSRLLSVENSARTRRAAAGMLLSFAQTFFPDHPDLYESLLRESDKLGGASVRPDGGRSFRLLRDILGWKNAMRLRRMLGRRPS